MFLLTITNNCGYVAAITVGDLDTTKYMLPTMPGSNHGKLYQKKKRILASKDNFL
jgi:hypothetical protein